MLLFWAANIAVEVNPSVVLRISEILIIAFHRMLDLAFILYTVLLERFI